MKGLHPFISAAKGKSFSDNAMVAKGNLAINVASSNLGRPKMEPAAPFPVFG
jgi:hypothetical protein